MLLHTLSFFCFTFSNFNLLSSEVSSFALSDNCFAVLDMVEKGLTRVVFISSI